MPFFRIFPVDHLADGNVEIHKSIIIWCMIRNAGKTPLVLVPENSNLVYSKCHPKVTRAVMIISDSAPTIFFIKKAARFWNGWIILKKSFQP
jgi:hypothetical protein